MLLMIGELQMAQLNCALEFSFNTSGTAGLTSKSTNPAVLTNHTNNANKILLDSNSGIVGGCYEFDDGESLSTTLTNPIDPNNGVSISLWTYSDNHQENNGVNRWVTLGSDLMTIRKQTSLSAINQVQAYIKSGGDIDWQGDHILVSNQVTNGLWEHWVFTFNGIKSIILYKNGIQIGAKTTPDQGITSSIDQIIIAANSSEWYNGKLDEVMVFDRELTIEQVVALYNGGNPDYEKIVKEETVRRNMDIKFNSL